MTIPARAGPFIPTLSRLVSSGQTPTLCYWADPPRCPPLMGSPGPGFGCARLAELPYSPWRIGSRNPSLPIARSPQPRPLGRKRSRRPALRARPARALPRACPVSALHLASADPIRSLSHAVVQDGTAQSNRGKNTGISTKQPKGRSCRRCLRHSRHSVGRLRFCRLCTAAS